MSPNETLGVPLNATKEEIKSAYRKKVMECHPDRNPGDTDAVKRFHEVQEAYEALSDPGYQPHQGSRQTYQTRPSRPKPRGDSWIKDAPPPTHDIWGEPINGYVEKPRPRPKPRPAPVRPKPEPEVDLWKTLETKSSRLANGYWKEYDRLKLSMAYEDPDNFWIALDEWVKKNK